MPSRDRPAQPSLPTLYRGHRCACTGSHVCFALKVIHGHAPGRGINTHSVPHTEALESEAKSKRVHTPTPFRMIKSKPKDPKGIYTNLASSGAQLFLCYKCGPLLRFGDPPQKNLFPSLPTWQQYPNYIKRSYQQNGAGGSTRCAMKAITSRSSHGRPAIERQTRAHESAG